MSFWRAPWVTVKNTIHHAVSPSVEMHRTHLKGTHFEKFIKTGQVKNLFFKVPKRGGKLKNRLFLVSALVQTSIDNKVLSQRLGVKTTSPLRLARKDVVKSTLKVPVGSVTPLALSAPSSRDVFVLLDQKFHKSERLLLHPMRSDYTTAITPKTLEAFLKRFAANRFIYVDFASKEPVSLPDAKRTQAKPQRLPEYWKEEDIFSFKPWSKTPYFHAHLEWLGMQERT